MGFVYLIDFYEFSKPCELFYLKPSVFSENYNKNLGCPCKFYHMFMCIAPSSVQSLLNPNLPLKWILRRFEAAF